MIQENEVIMLLIAVGVLIFALISRPRLNRLPASRTLFAAFYVRLLGWVLTVLEGFVLGETLNLLEHGCYAISVTLLAAWCWQVFGRKEGRT